MPFVALVALVAAVAAQADPAAVLATMKSAATKLRSLHAIVRAEESAGGKVTATRFVECWIDVKGGRVRTEVRDQGRASPHLLFVAGPTGMRCEQLEIEEVAQQVRPFELGTALLATFSGELLATAFRGELATFKAAAYGKPTVGASGEGVDGVGCTRLTFAGNGVADLWVGDGDHLPRRIRGPIATTSLEETIVLLAIDPDLSKVEFEIPVPEGRHLPDVAEVRSTWSRLPPERERWPKPETDAADFAALDLDAVPHLLSETAEQEVVIAFWLAEDARSPARAAEAEKAWRAAGAKGRFVHVAAGAEREPVARAAAKNDLKAPVWVAGSHANDAFRRWRIWTCPVFARVADMQVLAVTDDLAEVRRWFQ